MNTSSLIVWLPLHASTTKDLCGNSWTAYGAPKISNGALKTNGTNQYLELTNFTPPSELFNSDFTIHFYMNYRDSKTSEGGFFSFYPDAFSWQCYGSKARFNAHYNNNGNTNAWYELDSALLSEFKNAEHHFAMVRKDNTLYFFLDGALKKSYTVGTFTDTVTTLHIARRSNHRTALDMRDFCIHTEALWTENFTPPTDDELFAAEVELAGFAERVIDADTSAQIDNVPILNSATKVWLTADNYPTEDIAGNLWHAYNNPTSNGALQLSGVNQWLAKDGGITLGGKDFTIRGKFNVNSSSGSCARVFTIHQTMQTDANLITICRNDTSTTTMRFACMSSKTNFNCSHGVEHDFEVSYVHADKIFRCFVDGSLVATKTNYTLNQTSFANCWLGRSNYFGDGSFAGTIDEFQIIDGIALHTQNFIPMTVAEIDALKADFNARYSIGFSVQNQIDNAPLTWRYENAGFASLVLPDATTLNNLPATQSKTSVAFYQTSQAKSFDCDAAKTIWIKFDLYHQGGNAFRVFSTSNGKTGIYRSSNTRLQLYSNGSAVLNIDNVLATNTLQTWLLRMTSGIDSGAIELWCDGVKCGEYIGNVNNGVDFSNIYLQSDGVKNLFSNVIISNGELTFSDNLSFGTVNVESNADIDLRQQGVPPDNSEDTCYCFLASSNSTATLPLEVLAGVAEFTIEVKFSTLSTASNNTYYNQPAIIQRDVSGYNNNSWGFCVNDGVLCFWAEPQGYSQFNLVSTAVVNDGAPHKVVARSNQDFSLDLFCDGKCVAHLDNAHVKNSSTVCISIAPDMEMNLFEARFWSTALPDDKLFADLKNARQPVQLRAKALKSITALRSDSSMTDLEGWYLPTEVGVLDYSPYVRNVTQLSNATYSTASTVYVAVEYRTRNESTRWRYENVAIILGTGEPIYFFLPASHEVWALFDVFFGGGQWRVGEHVLGSFTGVASDSTLAVCFYSNGSVVKTLPDVVKERSTQRFLLHMVSDASNGLIELWSGLDKLEGYVGNVNNGYPFYSFACWSQNISTSFSNFMISNLRLEPSENPTIVRVTEMLNVVNCKTTIDRIKLDRGGNYPLPFIDVTMRDVMRMLVEKSEDIGDFVYSPIMSVWCRFTVRFDSTSNWWFYNNDGNGECGICASSAGTTFLSNGEIVKQDSAAGEADQWQTVLIHMDSGAIEGLIEMLTEDGRYFSWTGNVNVAEEFNNFTLMAENGDNVFLNFIISTFPLSLDIKRTTTAGEKYLAFNVRHNGEVVTAPLIPSASQGDFAFSVRWAGANWYNALVLPSAETATPIVVLHNGGLYALSSGTP